MQQRKLCGIGADRSACVDTLSPGAPEFHRWHEEKRFDVKDGILVKTAMNQREEATEVYGESETTLIPTGAPVVEVYHENDCRDRWGITCLDNFYETAFFFHLDGRNPVSWK